MMTSNSMLDTAFSHTLFEAASQAWRDDMSAHFCRMCRGETSVLNWQDPLELIRQAESFLIESVIDRPFLDQSISAHAAEQLVVDRIRSLLRKMLSAGQNLHHPHYIGHQVAASVPIAGLFDAVASITNQGMAIFEMGPWATAVDHAIVRALCAKVGWNPDESSGLVTHGGSIANLTALLTARNVVMPASWEEGVSPNAVLIVHPDAHYCVARSAGILGLGTKQVIRAEMDSEGRLDAVSLDQKMQDLKQQGKIIIAVSACACTTPTGTFDRLHELADVCHRNSVWLHVDAAHGGGLLMSRSYRHHLSGIERADSVVWDAHKMLFVPALCAAVLYRNAAHRFATFQQNAPYLFDPSAPGMADIDSGMRTLECTKRAAGFGLWGLWSVFGETIFEQLVDRTIGLARTLHTILKSAADFEPVNDPECNIVVFRYIPDRLRGASLEDIDRLQRELRTVLIRSGQFYIVQTTFRGRAVLRTVVMNPMTTEDDFLELLEAIRNVDRQRG
ncbi:MAG: pyridoxal phosphate-dependent decarboxylase family protein [Planctomycetota bacterium]